MVFTTNRNTKSDIAINIEGHAIDEVSYTFFFWGVYVYGGGLVGYIDNRLKF